MKRINLYKQYHFRKCLSIWFSFLIFLVLTTRIHSLRGDNVFSRVYLCVCLYVHEGGRGLSHVTTHGPVQTCSLGTPGPGPPLLLRGPLLTTSLTPSPTHMGTPNLFTCNQADGWPSIERPSCLYCRWLHCSSVHVESRELIVRSLHGRSWRLPFGFQKRKWFVCLFLGRILRIVEFYFLGKCHCTCVSPGS